MEKPSSFFYLTPWFSDMKIDTNKYIFITQPSKSCKYNSHQSFFES